MIVQTLLKYRISCKFKSELTPSLHNSSTLYPVGFMTAVLDTPTDVKLLIVGNRLFSTQCVAYHGSVYRFGRRGLV